MKHAYITLTKGKIDISSLRTDEKAFLGHVVKACQAGESYPNLVNRIHTPGSPALGGGQWVTKKVQASPLYRVCQDLADRQGISQGFLALGSASSLHDTGFVQDREPGYISSNEAAKLIHVTPEAIRKAIRQKRLPAKRLGHAYLLERRAVEGYAARSRWSQVHSTPDTGRRVARRT